MSVSFGPTVTHAKFVKDDVQPLVGQRVIFKCGSNERSYYIIGRVIGAEDGWAEVDYDHLECHERTDGTNVCEEKLGIGRAFFYDLGVERPQTFLDSFLFI